MTSIGAQGTVVNRFFYTMNRHLSVPRLARAPHVFRLLALRPTDAVLEVGCGAGSWTRSMASLSRTVVAFDLDPDKILLARRCAVDHRAMNVHLLVASAEAIPLAPDTFNKVVCIDVIEHVRDDFRAVGQVARTLRPGGVLVMSTLRAGRRPLVRPVVFSDHLREYSWPRFLSLVERAGLETVGAFEFYRRFATLAWEGQYAVMETKWLRRVPGLSSLIWWLLGGMAYLDVLSRMPGNGLGVSARKRTQEMQA